MTEEEAAAYERYRQVGKELERATVAYQAALARQIEAAEELSRVQRLATPLRDLLLHKITRTASAKPWTVKRLAGYSLRPVAEVTECLDALTAEGLICAGDRGGYVPGARATDRRPA